MERDKNNPDNAPPEFVRPWKAAELMSYHLNSLDVLANPQSLKLHGGRAVNFYGLVDKVVRIYQVFATDRKVKLRVNGHSSPEVWVDPNTIFIIPSVFIDNAVKYAREGGLVEVFVAEGVRNNTPIVVLNVIGEGPSATADEEAKLFRTPVRGHAARKIEGSGLGLTIARKVADQHRGWCSFEQRSIDANRANWTFTFEMPLTK